jgi:isopropylmalate/homocitrate/citramalate synthase
MENQTELFPFRPEFVGQAPADVVMGKGSGIDSIKIWLERFQIQASDEQAQAILMAVKAKGSDTSRLLTDEEFRSIADEAIAA